jgi:hypothetical protein
LIKRTKKELFNFAKGNKVGFIDDTIAAGQKPFEPMLNWTKFEILINFKYVIVIFGILYVLYHNIGELNTVFLIGEEVEPRASFNYTMSSVLLPEK